MFGARPRVYACGLGLTSKRLRRAQPLRREASKSERPDHPRKTVLVEDIGVLVVDYRRVSYTHSVFAELNCGRRKPPISVVAKRETAAIRSFGGWRIPSSVKCSDAGRLSILSDSLDLAGHRLDSLLCVSPFAGQDCESANEYKSPACRRKQPQVLRGVFFVICSFDSFELLGGQHDDVHFAFVRRKVRHRIK
jgi:hypothetical protein